MNNVAIPVGSLTPDDRLRLAELFDAAAGVLQPTHKEGHAEARATFLRTLGDALRESGLEERHRVNAVSVAEDASLFYGDGDPGSSS